LDFDLSFARTSVLRRGYWPGSGPAVVIPGLQSGFINDYITWLGTGVAASGAVLALAVR
jgi:hypothetical protein